MNSGKCPFPHDDLLGFLKHGYPYTSQQRNEAGAEGTDKPVRLTVMGKPAILLRGKEGVRTFYDNSLIKRNGSMPTFIQGSLFGNGSVHSLDDEEHMNRKRTFVRVCYDDAQVARMEPMIEEEVREALQRAAKHPEDFYDAMVIAYGRASLRWAGIEGTDAELDVVARRLGEIVEGFAHVDLDHAKSWINRRLTDRWGAQVIKEQREGKRNAQPGTSLFEWANHRDTNGQLLSPKMAGLEMQNTYRPHIAVARFAAFAAKELAERPEWRQRIQKETAERGSLTGGPLARAFAQEIRRTAPFVPLLPSFARKDFEVQGEQIKEGDRVMIDVLNTNTSPLDWEGGAEFNPERFVGVDDYESLEAFIPQGGSKVETGHRCPGEKIAINSLATSIAALCEPGVEILDVPEVDMSKMPTRPYGIKWKYTKA